ncbi:MAG: acyltransferase [Ilumatobacteraceae bacterium]|nr:acyltransferase [Ilumatobacteraceae bacterium]
MKRRTDIEGLRAIAVLAVLLFHAGVPGVGGGYVGVDVFFVVSGFLITSLLVAEKTNTGTVSLGAFYARRARRILPVSALVAVVTLIASWIWLEPLRLRSLSNDVLAVALFSSNFVFANRGADYLQSALPPSPLQHYWSLAVEEQFYVAWPALVMLVCLGVGTRTVRNVRLRVGVIAGIASVVSFIACMALMNTSQPWAFFSPHTRAFELAIGALVAVVPIGVSLTVVRMNAALAWCGLAGIIATVMMFSETTTFPGPWALAPVMATAFLLRGGNATSWSPDALLRLSPMQWLGSRSYSAYLWHWPVLIIAAAALDKKLSVFEGLVCLMMSLALSEFSYRCVENPVRRNHNIVGIRALVLSVSLIAVVSGSAVLAQNNQPTLDGGVAATAPTLITESSTTVDSNVSTTTIPVEPELPNQSPPVEAIVQAMSATGLPSNITPSLQGAISDMPTIYSNNCHASFSATRPKKCVYGDVTSSTVIGLYGDSHAAQWFPAFEKLAIKRNWKFISYTKRGCPPADIPTYSKVLGKVYKECAPWRENVLQQMVTDGVQTVFIAQFDRLLSASTRVPMWQKEWRVGLQSTIDQLTAKGITPVLMEDTPYPGQDVPTCLSRHYTNVQLCNPIISSAFREDMHQMLEDFDAADTHVLWTRQWFCTDVGCPTVVGNILVYRDDNHMSVTFASFIAPLLDAAIVDVVTWASTHP